MVSCAHLMVEYHCLLLEVSEESLNLVPHIESFILYSSPSLSRTYGYYGPYQLLREACLYTSSGSSSRILERLGSSSCRKLPEQVISLNPRLRTIHICGYSPRIACSNLQYILPINWLRSQDNLR